MSTESLGSKRRRRTYTPQFKAEMVAQCLEGTVSLASLAVEHGMNPNVLHRWVMEHERYGKHSLQDDATTPVYSDTASPANWIPVALPGSTAKREVAPRPDKIIDAPPRTPSNAPTTRQTIALELSKRDLRMTLRWPGDDHRGLAGFVRELLR